MNHPRRPSLVRLATVGSVIAAVLATTAPAAVAQPEPLVPGATASSAGWGHLRELTALQPKTSDDASLVAGWGHLRELTALQPKTSDDASLVAARAYSSLVAPHARSKLDSPPMRGMIGGDAQD